MTNNKRTKSKLKTSKTVSPGNYKGRETHINHETGEMEEVDVITHKTKQDINYKKIWLFHMAQALDLIGNAKIKVLSYLIENANKDNIVYGTQEEIAEGAGVSRSSVSRTISTLKETDFIRTQTARIQINPNLMFKGKNEHRMNVLHRYEKVENEDIEDEDKKEGSGS